MTPLGRHTNGRDHDPEGPDSGADSGPTADASLAERLRAMGLGEAGDPGRDQTGDPGAGGSGASTDPRAQLAALGAQMETLSTGLAAQANRLRDAERSLVDRIADVDDDRRRTQGQQLRAMQSQYDEIDARLRRQGALNLLGLGLIAALALGGLFLLHHNQQERLGELRGELTAEVQNLGLELGRLSSAAAQESQVQDKLAALSTALARVTEDLDQVGTTGAGGNAGPEATSLGGEIARLDSEQQRLRADLDALRSTPRGEVASAAGGAGSLVEQIGAQVGALQQDQQRLGAEIEALRTYVSAAGPDQAKTAADPGEAVGPETGASSPATAGTPSEPADQLPDQPQGQVLAPGRTFALQLLGSYDRQAILGLAARTDLPASVFIRQETLRGRPWFVLIHSLHGSYAEAQEARAALPRDLARLDPWIRTLPPDAALEPLRTGPSP
ncbi:MAG: SPOR domain-containing protein [Bdellovibrio bacteriovorus]